MRKIILGILLICTLSACSVNKQSLGLGRQTPDEFMVMKRQPLSIPPEYNLTPPEPGKDPLKQTKPEQQAEELLFGQTNETKEEFSETDESFLNEIDALNPQSDIRAVLNEEIVNDPANNKYLINDLMFWQDKDNSVIVDNLEEAKRIKANKKRGANISDGDTPVLNPKD